MRQFALAFICLCAFLQAQDPAGILEGQIQDPAGAMISYADVTVENAQTGYKLTQRATSDGTFRFSNLPIGEYSLRADANGFAPFSALSTRVDIGRVVRLPVKLQIAGQRSEISRVAVAQTTDLGTAIGNVISSREAVDLPFKRA